MPIRRATPADHPAALRVIGDAFGLVMRPPTVHTVVAQNAHGHLLVAERDGTIVGTAAGVGFGATGWIGGIAVVPEARGARLGQQLTEAVIDALGPRDAFLLLATPAGRPVYERLGFMAEERYAVFWSPADATPDHDGLRTLTAADRDEVLALDRRVTGEERTLAVDVGLHGAAATPDLAAVALRPPWPALPILARDPDAGERLLRALLGPGLRVAVPEANARAVRTLEALGCSPAPPVVRMRRGAPVSWRPDEVWGVFSLFFG